METIEVFYTPLGPFGGWYHKYLVYTDAGGNKFYARGGPSSGKAGSSSTDDWLTSDDNVSWGNIITEYGAYTPTTIDYDHENDDPSELIASAADLSSEWALITQAMDAIELAAHGYDPFGPNSNTTVDSALALAGLSLPTMDDLFDSGDNWAPGSGATLAASPNTFAAYDGNPQSLVARIAGAGANFLAGEISFNGADSAVAYFENLTLGNAKLINGFVLTTGAGTVPASNTSGGYGVNLGLSGDAALTSVVQSVFPSKPETFDANSLTFSVNIDDASIGAVMIDLVFASEEYPEFVDDFVDIGAVFVNGKNVAFFGGDPNRPLSVISSNLGAFQDNTGGAIPIEYDGISNVLTILAPVKQGENTIRIAIADTGDHIYDSALFVSNFRVAEFDASGLKIKLDAGADINLPNTLNGGDEGEYVVGGGGDDTVDGGGGDDIILGGDGNDTLNGGAGNDQFASADGADSVNGGDGDDTIIGGSGAGDDLYIGGPGSDFVRYLSTTNGVIVDLAAGTATGPEIGNDTLTSIENAIGGKGDDELYGDAGANILAGAEGNDTLDGRTGSDTASYEDAIGGVNVSTASSAAQNVGGGQGSDLLVNIENLLGSDFDDTLGGSSAANNFIGGAGDDRLIGLGGNDSLFGGFGRDRALGGSGDDFIRTGPDNDTLIGGNGDDTLGASNRTDLLRGEGGRDLLLGSNGNDRLFGDGANDTLLGGNGRDTIAGGAGADRIIGGRGDDRIRGQEGDDTLKGDDGDDRFAIFVSDASVDVILDFAAGAGSDDKIVLVGFGASFDTFAEIVAAATDDGVNTTIDFGANSIVLNGVLVSQLHDDDFIFG